MWNQWSKWTACSNLCGGFKSHSRNCTNVTAGKCLVPETGERKTLNFVEEQCPGIIYLH